MAVESSARRLELERGEQSARGGEPALGGGGGQVRLDVEDNTYPVLAQNWAYLH